MNINAIPGTNLTAGLLQVSQGMGLGLGQAGTAAQAGTFQQFFAEAIENTNRDQLEAQQKVKQLVTGEIEDIHQVMVAMEKASLSFQLTMQVRNKVVDAYQEIMRMQV